MIILVSFWQYSNVDSLIVEIEFGIVIDVRLEHNWKAYLSISFMEFGINTEVRAEQPANVDSSIFVTLFGILIEVSDLQ